jgi:polyisoprenoid-binding protein YceI
VRGAPSPAAALAHAEKLREGAQLRARRALTWDGHAHCSGKRESSQRGAHVSARNKTRSSQMIVYDANTAQCVVYSFKEGLLSKLAHDLKHRVTRFSVRVDEQTRAIEAEIDAQSLKVECVMKEGVETENGISDDDRKKIEGQIIEDVLNARKHPLIKFRSTAVVERPDALEIQGILELNDHRRPVTTLARRVNGHYVAQLTINQPEFSITPFSAMMGALKIKPEVLVRIHVPAH